MKTIGIAAPLAFVAIAFISTPAAAADRVRAGEWETTLTLKGGSPTTIKTCMTKEEAGYLNGEAEALRKYVSDATKKSTNGRCAIADLKVKGSQVVVKTVCGKSETVVTTEYHGDSYESLSSDGTTTVGKRLGDCP